jgi:hypothetical protein
LTYPYCACAARPIRRADPAALKTGLHSERVASLYLQLKVSGANSTTKKGLSERIPCESPTSMCRKNLEERTWFPSIANVRYLTSRPTSADAKNAGTDAPTVLKAGYDSWVTAGTPTGLDAPVERSLKFGYTPV